LLVTDVEVLSPQHCSQEALLALVASVEEHANHPVAKAVVDAARERDLQHITHGEVDFLVAHGMSAEVDGQRIVIGSRHYLEEHEDIDFSIHQTQIEELQDEGKTLLYVGSEGYLIGLLALRDTVRGEAAEVLGSLRAFGVNTLIMITGDRKQKANALAKELGLDEVYAEMHPEEKAIIIEALQNKGCKVAFVGDGVNDGPALAAADVGIAMPRGAEIARATADIVLLDDRLMAVAAAREIAQRTMQLIQLNFNLAVGINTGILAGAMLGWLSPVSSTLLHNGTTLGILFNALAGVNSSPEIVYKNPQVTHNL
jgi:P-type E1-E2 ATPase